MKFLCKIVKLFDGFTLNSDYFTRFTAKILKAMRFLDKTNRPLTRFPVFSSEVWYMRFLSETLTAVSLLLSLTV